MNKLNSQKGFTLIEMLVVVAIIGLLSSVVVVGLSGAREQARDARRVAETREVQNALELAYSSVDGYPVAIPANAPQTGPQGDNYEYEPYNPDGGSFMTDYKLGINLEGNDHDTSNDVTCPTNVTSPGFCVDTNTE
ncbi:MAG: type II secretion system protein [Candidatus Paceibacterota bacterium]